MTTRYFTTLFCMCIALLASAQGLVENQGQWKEPFLYKCEVPGGAVFLEQQQLTFHLVDRSGIYGPHGTHDPLAASNIEKHHAFRFRFIGAQQPDSVSSSDFAVDYHNYFLGKANRWRSKIHPAQTVRYTDLYDGIDLVIRSKNNRLKYEFHVNPGADPRDVRIAIEGSDGLKLDRQGNLEIATSIASVVESAPFVYQGTADDPEEIKSHFVIAGQTVSYAIESYDSSQVLIIDPELIFSTFSGSTSDNWGYTATPDPGGHVYAGSATTSTGYPTTIGAFDVSFNGPSLSNVPADVTITKFDSSGTSLIYSTYLGGSTSEVPHSLIADDNGNLFILGTTDSEDFPVTNNGFDRTFNGGPAVNGVSYSIPYINGVDMFVTKLNPTGTALVSSTFLGGSGTDGLNFNQVTAYNYADEARGDMVLDDDGNVVIGSSTTSTNFPGTSGTYQSSKGANQDGIIIKMNSSLSSVLWATYLGGNGQDAVNGVAVASDGSIYVCGGTSSTNFPAHNGAYQTSNLQGRCDGFISHLNSGATAMLHSTYFGTGFYDQMYLLQLDQNDHPHVFGQTESTGSNFIFNADFNNPGGGQVLAHFQPDLESLVWSTQFGSTSGRPNISPTSFLVDVCNSVYLAGWGGSVQQFGNNNASNASGLPVTNDAFKSTPDGSGSEFYLCVIDADANTQSFGSFFGGDQSGTEGGEHVDGGTSRFDRSGKIYQAVCAGCGGSDNFPVHPDPGAWSTSNGSSNCNLGVFKIDFELPLVIADFAASDFGCAPYTIKFNNRSVIQNATSYDWDFGDGNSSTVKNPTHTFTQAGQYTIRLIVSDPNTCNLHDTLDHLLTIKKDTAYSIDPIDTCIGSPVVLGPNAADYPDLDQATISWSPAILIDDPNSLNPTASAIKNTTFVLSIDYGGCIERISQEVRVERFDLEVSDDTIVCSNFSPFTISGTAPNDTATYEWATDPAFENVVSTTEILLIETLTDPLTRFYFKATKDNGCSMMDTVLVTVSDWDIDLTNDTAICQDELVRVEAVSENPENQFAYYWTLAPYPANPDQELLTDTLSNFINVILNAPEQYYLYASSQRVEGCTAKDSVLITVSALGKNDVVATAAQDSFYFGEYVQLNGTPTSFPEVSWSPERFLDNPNIPDPTARPKEAMTYVYTVSDTLVESCTYSDSVYIYPYTILCGEPEVYLPTAFSPNGDGINEELKLYGNNVTALNMAIYDRWGNAVFETTDKNNGWDGTYKGAEVQHGVYVYYYEATCIDQQRIFRKGNVTLLK